VRALGDHQVERNQLAVKVGRANQLRRRVADLLVAKLDRRVVDAEAGVEAERGVEADAHRRGEVELDLHREQRDAEVREHREAAVRAAEVVALEVDHAQQRGANEELGTHRQIEDVDRHVQRHREAAKRLDAPQVPLPLGARLHALALDGDVDADQQLQPALEAAQAEARQIGDGGDGADQRLVLVRPLVVVDVDRRQIEAAVVVDVVGMTCCCRPRRACAPPGRRRARRTRACTRPSTCARACGCET
jgi:hypothetical protein